MPSPNLPFSCVVGTIADDAADIAQNPVKVGARAVNSASLPTAAAVGDVVDLITDTSRRLIVTVGGSVSSVSVGVAGDVADDAADSGNPIKVGARAVDPASLPTAVAANDRVHLLTDLSRLLLVNTRKLTATDDFVSIAGDVAADAVDSGMPVKIGGRANSISVDPPAVSHGDRCSATFDTFGRQTVLLVGKDTLTAFASAARTATSTGSDQTVVFAKGVLVFCNVTAVAGSASITVSIDGKDPVSATYYSILTSAAITSTGLTRLMVYPGLTTSSTKADDAIPRTWRVKVTNATSDSITYSVGCVYLP